MGQNTGSTLVWEKSRNFATPSVVSPENDVLETSAEIPYWQSVTTQIWVVLLIGCSKFCGESTAGVAKCRLFSQAGSASITYYLHVINLPPVLPSRFTSVCFVVSGPQSRVPMSNGSSNALLNHAVVKEGWNSMWRANRANPRRRQRNEKNLMRGTTAVPWNKITQLLIIFTLIMVIYNKEKVLFTDGLCHTTWFSIAHFHFIIGLPVAQPNYKRSFRFRRKKTKWRMDHPEDIAWPTPCNKAAHFNFLGGDGSFPRGGDLFGGFVLDPFDDPRHLNSEQMHLYLSISWGRSS